MEKQTPSINLFKKTQRNFFDHFLAWALTYGRLVIIVTEGIALMVFLYRFSLDRQLIDLHDKIDQKKVVVELLKTNEEKYRNLQERLSLAERLGDSSTRAVAIFQDIAKLAEEDVRFKNITLSPDTLRVEANVQSVASLTRFVKALRTYQNIKTVSLDKIENKPTLAIIAVSITASLKK